MPVSLTPRERVSLKGRAHPLEPIVHVGQAGLTDAVVRETERALAAHELIKVRIGAVDRVERAQLGETLCVRTDAALVLSVGKVFVLWRMHDDVARPEFITVSYNEGTRWADSGDNVDGVALPVELLPWIAEFVEQHYRPEPQKKKRYASNKDRGRMGRPE